MTACVHTPKYPDPLSIPSMAECRARCSLVEGDAAVAHQRALTSADGATTKIDAPYWQTLNEAQQCAVIAHERAHPEIGMAVDCEGCADKVAGYYMRAWGYAPHVVRATYASLRVGRKVGQGNIADNAAAGAREAERALAGRGLLGKGSHDLHQARQQHARVLHESKQEALRAAAKNHPAQSPLASAASIDPGGPVTGTGSQAAAPVSAAPSSTTTPTNASGTFNAPSVVADTADTKGSAGGSSDVAGDVVSAVLGESARPHAGKVLIAMGVAATVAVVLVIIVRHVGGKKGE